MERTTTCPFCLNGCTSAVAFNGYQYWMEYPISGKVNRGRLCPRGNSASIVLDHPCRLSYPLADGKETSWDSALNTLRSWLGSVRPEEIVIVQSRGLTEEEGRLLRGFAKALSTKNLVRGYLEPDNCFRYQLVGTKPATLEYVRSAKAVLLVGDVFSTSPVLSGPMLEARYADRKNRLVVIDSLRTRQAGFAHQFIQVRPGTEAFALLALAGLGAQSSGLDVDRYAELAGVSRKELEIAAKTLKGLDRGLVGCAMHLGRVKHPVLLSLAAQLVATGFSMPFVGFAETRVPDGWMRFSEFRKVCGEGRFKLVLWFGALYPYSYPELLPELAKVEHRAATAIFRPKQDVPGLVLPVASELEKETKGVSYWGEIERYPLASAPSGTRMPAWIMGQLAVASSEAIESPGRFTAAQVAKLGTQYAESVVTRQQGLLLLGEKRAFGIAGFYADEDEVVVNPADAVQLGLADGSRVRVTTISAGAEFRVHLSNLAPEGALVVGVNAHRNRALFPLVADPVLGETEIPPVAVQVVQTETAASLPVEVIRSS